MAPQNYTELEQHQNHRLRTVSRKQFIVDFNMFNCAQISLTQSGNINQVSICSISLSMIIY